MASNLSNYKMTLNVDLRTFLDDKGQVVELTEQAEIVFSFLIKIVSAVSAEHLDVKELVAIDLACNTRAQHVRCKGSIEAGGNKNGVIEWHCDTCEAAGTISYWQASLWDKQLPTIH